MAVVEDGVEGEEYVEGALEEALGEVGDVVEDGLGLEEAEAEAEAPPEEEEMGEDELEGQVVDGAEVPVPEEDEEEDLEDDDDEGVQEHLKDAVEGTLRLKRLLSAEGGEAQDGPVAKKRKTSQSVGAAELAQINILLQKWAMMTDAVARHILESLSLEELEAVNKSGFIPDKFNRWKSPSELIASYIAQMRERNGPGGGPLDAITTFKARWSLPAEADGVLRKLNHKDLRWVLREYDGEMALEDAVVEAGNSPPEEVGAAGALPEAPGASTMGRFHRLELIDPLADCAVFGDANLTFSLKLAKHRKALGHVGRVIATTFEQLDTLRERYKEIDETIKTLEEHYAEVYHGVDCTRIAIDPRFEGMEGQLGAVYYNFPHAGAVSGFFDGHPLVNWRHENLMRLFFRGLRFFVRPGGWVKVSSNMGAVGVRYSYIIGSAMENEFLHAETVPFLEWHLHRYGRSYGDRRDAYKRPGEGQGYNVQRAEADMVYVFQYSPSGHPMKKQQIRNPPKMGTLLACTDGPFKNLTGESKKVMANNLFKRFVTECSGVHVG